MDFKVVFSDSFVADLELIVRRIAHENPAAAQKLGDLVVRSAENLRFFPERYPRVRQRPELRRFIVAKHYKVFYRVQPQMHTVEILRLWDAHRHSDPI